VKVEKLEKKIDIMLQGIDVPDPKLRILDPDIKPKLNQPVSKRYVSIVQILI
jgi:hypothetical protein